MDLFRKQIKDEIESLNRKNKIIYCLLISEKLLPNYKYFSSIYDFGSVKKLEDIINVLYDYVFDKKHLTTEDVDIYLSEIEEITPDTNDFSTILVSFALDACTSVISTLNFIKNNNDNDVLDVACYARDTVDMFIQERDDLNLNNKELEILIDNDVLMTTEKNKQIIIAKYLKENQLINRISLDELRRLNYGSIIDVNIFKD